MIRTFWDTWASGRQPRLTGRHVIVVLVCVTMVTAVGLPAFGWAVNRRRVVRTEAAAAEVADAVRQMRERLVARAVKVDVVCGPGRIPDPGPTGQWVSRAVQAPGVFVSGTPTDAWGRCFLVNLDGLLTGTPVWVMSAGPDGFITTFPTATRLAGDDIGVRVE